MIYTDKTKRAIKLCFKAHAGQVDKSGLPYAHHPLHLAEKMDDENSTVVALLHDVVEDTDYTIMDIKGMGFGVEVVRALELLTHDPEISYFDYIKAIVPSQLAKKVKLADLEHNSDVTRLKREPNEKDRRRLDKYRLAKVVLENDLTYRYPEPSFEEVEHKEDEILNVSPERYESFLLGFHYGMIAYEIFLRKQFEIEESVLIEELDNYRNHMIEFTWMELREDPEWHFIQRHRHGVLEAKLLPAKEGDRFYEEIEYNLNNPPDTYKNEAMKPGIGSLYINYYFKELKYDDYRYSGVFHAPDNDVYCEFIYYRDIERIVLHNANKPIEEILPIPINWLNMKLEERGYLNSSESKISY